MSTNHSIEENRSFFRYLIENIKQLKKYMKNKDDFINENGLKNTFQPHTDQKIWK